MSISHWLKSHIIVAAIRQLKCGCICKRFHEEALDCYDTVAEDVNLRLPSWNNWGLPYLSKEYVFLYIDEGREVNKISVKKTSRSSSLIRSTLMKRPIIADVEKNKRVKASSSKRISYGKKEIRRCPILPPFLCGMKKPHLYLSNGLRIVSFFCR